LPRLEGCDALADFLDDAGVFMPATVPVLGYLAPACHIGAADSGGGYADEDFAWCRRGPIDLTKLNFARRAEESDQHCASLP
jgi:hypothetical protein